MLSISRICGLIIHTQMAYKEENSRRHIILVGVILFIEIQCVSKHLIFFPHEIFFSLLYQEHFVRFSTISKAYPKKYYEANGKKKHEMCVECVSIPRFSKVICIQKFHLFRKFIYV